MHPKAGMTPVNHKLFLASWSDDPCLEFRCEPMLPFARKHRSRAHDLSANRGPPVLFASGAGAEAQITEQIKSNERISAVLHPAIDW